jgi:hypothetical protein
MVILRRGAGGFAGQIGPPVFYRHHARTDESRTPDMVRSFS